jgi:hypothetical protein
MALKLARHLSDEKKTHEDWERSQSDVFNLSLHE